ncbi:MAG: RraA family protein [Hyphomicrobiaceae bacterium]
MLKDPPLLTIRRDFPRPSLALVDKLKGAQTGHMTDAMYGRGALDAEIKPVDPRVAVFVGIALPCESFADDNLAIVAALAFAKPGDVLIAASDGFSRTAVVGDNVAMMAKNAGVRAIVIDGMARDLDGIVEAGLPVFARGITPNSCVKNGPGKVGLPVVAGGVRIEPGDVVIGDRDGVVIVPQGQLDYVLAHLVEIRRLEADIQGKIKNEKLVCPDGIRALLKSDKVVYVE